SLFALPIYTRRPRRGMLVHALTALVVGVVAASVFNQPDPLASFRVLGPMIPAVILLAVFCWAVTALCSIANVFFHDTQHLAELGLGICFFLTPIIYPKDRLIVRGLGSVAEANPVVAFLDVIRDPLLTGAPPTAVAFSNAF